MNNRTINLSENVLVPNKFSCAKNFLLSEIMKDHPIYAGYAYFYHLLASEELASLVKNEKPPSIERKE